MQNPALNEARHPGIVRQAAERMSRPDPRTATNAFGEPQQLSLPGSPLSSPSYPRQTTKESRTRGAMSTDGVPPADSAIIARKHWHQAGRRVILMQSFTTSLVETAIATARRMSITTVEFEQLTKTNAEQARDDATSRSGSRAVSVVTATVTKHARRYGSQQLSPQIVQRTDSCFRGIRPSSARCQILCLYRRWLRFNKTSTLPRRV